MAGEIKGTLKWLKNGVYEGKVEGKEYVIKFGEEGTSPMEAILLSVAGCTAMDVVLILKKMREPLEGLEIEIMGKRREGQPKIYSEVHIHYKIYGNVEESSVKRAIELSQEKYCSASAHIKLSGAKITYSYEISPKEE
ncbi:MAG TPA: OsmC family peroxiredoxin [Euryarchaeota archaeon]|nr:OsmC family peroxiredoxin [Euryarchaeota archaeon]